MDLVPGEQRMDNGLNPHPHPHPHPHSHPQMVFQEDNLNLQFQPQRRLTTDPVRKTRDLSSFAVDKIFAVDGGDRYFPGGGEGEFRRNIYGNQTVPPHHHHQERPGNWNGEGSTESGGSEDDDDEEGEEDDDDDDDEGDGEVEGLVGLDDGNGNGNKNNNNSSGSVHSSSEKIRCAKANLRKQQHSSLGSSRAGLAKGGNGVHSVANNVRGSTSEQHNQQGRVGNFDNAVTIAEPDMYYSQFLQGAEGSALGQKEIGGENGCGFGSGKDVMVSMESGESLRAILSDPITGTLMDDAMILPCGHSFGSGGMQHVIRTKACYTCSQSVSEDLVSPNLSLRYAIQAFRREEELQNRVSKRRRDRFEQDKSSSGELSMYLSKGKGVQFPFAVTDRVIIKGNKRTPLRFVGREAVVTTQCLNGWYVVKTLDNAESVKLQYRSLAKVSDSPSSNMANKSTPNWL